MATDQKSAAAVEHVIPIICITLFIQLFFYQALRGAVATCTLLIDVHKTFFRIARPNQDHFIMFPKKYRGFGVDIQFILSANSYHAAARLFPDLTFSNSFARKG